LLLIFNIEHFQQFPNHPREFFGQIFCYKESIYLYKMKKLNSEDLFNIFSMGDEEVYKEHKVEGVMDDPFVLFGMAVRGVENYFIIDRLYDNRFGEKYDSVRDSIKLKYFIGLVRYLERIEEIQEDTLHIIEDEFGLQAIDYALQEMLDLFIEEEYYEKCTILSKFQQLSPLNQLVE
jgi:hypothetical protein